MQIFILSSPNIGFCDGKRTAVIQGPLKKGSNSLVQQLTILFLLPVLSKVFLCGTEIVFEPLQCALSICQICSCTCILWASKPGGHNPPPWLFATVLLPFGTGSGVRTV